ncbi:hypothetical protein KP509_02G056400 [Ceratopteris richardii]|uniref:Sulfotransferase n=1 Tax=Ceratopteris richardii TaxID=49495 RepID=A0A8T2VHK4_CERRI|nr:hypothetical protein KP509_02G056400 [Ceratopteris richardii]
MFFSKTKKLTVHTSFVFFIHYIADTNRSTKGFQVIVCGFPRTGTTSMILALHVLGFKCFHGAHTFNPRNVFVLDSAFKYETKVHWEKLLDGFNGISDWPGACAYKKLMDLFPHAKIILTTRDPKKWYKSYLVAIGGAKSPYKHIFKLIYPGSLRCMDRNFQKVMSSNDMDEDACIKCYENHNADVIENVSSQRLLVYNFENDEGWRPLCEFLEVPCPAIPFPSANNQASFNTFVRKAFIVRATIMVFYLLFILLCTIFILF